MERRASPTRPGVRCHPRVRQPLPDCEGERGDSNSVRSCSNCGWKFEVPLLGKTWPPAQCWRPPYSHTPSVLDGVFREYRPAITLRPASRTRNKAPRLQIFAWYTFDQMCECPPITG